MSIVGGRIPVTLFGYLAAGRKVKIVPSPILTMTSLGSFTMTFPPAVIVSKKARASDCVPANSRMFGLEPGLPALRRILNPFALTCSAKA